MVTHTNKGHFSQETEPVTITLEALSLVEKAEPVQVRFILHLRDQWSKWMQDGCKVYIDSYMALNGSCFMATSTVFKNHLLEVDLTQNRETMALRMLTTIVLFYFIMCTNPREWKFIEIAVGWRPGHVWLHTTLEGPWPHCVILDVDWDGLWTLSFGLSQSHGHGIWLVCEVALIRQNSSVVMHAPQQRSGSALGNVLGTFMEFRGLVGTPLGALGAPHQ